MTSPRHPILLTSLGNHKALKWQGLHMGLHKSLGHFMGFSRYWSLFTSIPLLTTLSYDLPLSHIHESHPGCFQVNCLSSWDQLKNWRQDQIHPVLLLSESCYNCQMTPALQTWFITREIIPRTTTQQLVTIRSLRTKEKKWEFSLSHLVPSCNTCPWDGIGISTGVSPTQGDLTGLKSKKNVKLLLSYTTLMLCAASQGKSDEYFKSRQLKQFIHFPAFRRSLITWPGNSKAELCSSMLLCLVS